MAASKIDFGAAARHRMMSGELPCTYLQKIDILWLKYSQNNFGFTPQSNVANSMFGQKKHQYISSVDRDAFVAKLQFDIYENKSIYKDAENYNKHLGMLPSNLWFYENSPFTISPIPILKSYGTCVQNQQSQDKKVRDIIDS